MSTPRIAQALAELATFAADDFTVDEMLWRLGEVAVATLSVDGVGVMGTNTGVGDRTRFVYASHQLWEPMEYLQEANQTGPCKEAATTLRTVVCTHPEELNGWPEFAGAARVAGVHTALAAPLVSRGACWGVLDLYWLSETSLDDVALAEVGLLAQVAVSYLVLADDRYRAGIAQQQLAVRLLHDTLTGLANRELIHELIHHALVNAHRRDRSVALLFIDLDTFKNVNDTRGHRAGDAVLIAVAHRMRDAVRASDTVCRLSGDEFLILCEDLSDDSADLGLTALGERILTEIGRPIDVDSGPPVVMSASIGIVITRGQPQVTDFIHDADQAMYQAKHDPRRRIVVQHHRHATSDINRRSLERRLVGALERGEIHLHYQAIVDLPAGRIGAAEAVLRWASPDQGLLPAAQFVFAIPHGTMIRIGHWAIAEALGQLRRWRNTDPTTSPDVVFLNLTVQQLIDEELVGVVVEQLRTHDFSSAALGFEITETALDDTRVRSVAGYLRARGHPLTIDDFGTGYPSLARMATMPAAHLKLDRSLVFRLPADPQARALLQAVSVLADSLNLAVIAEGVENVEQAEYLAGVGCVRQQGYQHGAVLAADDFTAALRSPTPGRAPRRALPRQREIPPAARLRAALRAVRDSWRD